MPLSLFGTDLSRMIYFVLHTGDQAELLKHVEPVIEPPVFHDLALAMRVISIVRRRQVPFTLFVCHEGSRLAEPYKSVAYQQDPDDGENRRDDDGDTQSTD